MGRRLQLQQYLAKVASDSGFAPDILFHVGHDGRPTEVPTSKQTKSVFGCQGAWVNDSDRRPLLEPSVTLATSATVGGRA
jgi:hypothetical protein